MAFPGIRDGRPFGAFALVWTLDEEQRREIAWIELGDDRTLTARGRQWCTGGGNYLLEYELETSTGYVTERLHARIDGGPALTLLRGSSRELDGVLDCDLGFSPLNGRSVPRRRRTSYCSGVSLLRNSASVSTFASAMTPSGRWVIQPSG